MKYPTEWRIIVEESPFEKHINSIFADNMKNLIIKENWLMIEELKRQREEYVAELEQEKLTDLEAIKAARFELVKETIAQEVEAEFNAKLAAIEENIAHYDFVIARIEETAVVEETTEETIVEE